MTTRILNLDGHNFKDFPLGGQLNFQRILLSQRYEGVEFSLAGLSSDPNEIPGSWHTRMIHDNAYSFFSLGALSRKPTKQRIPISLRYTWGAAYYKAKLLHYDPELVLYAHNPEVLIPFLKEKHKMIYHVHGTPLHKAANSKYSWFQSGIAGKLYMSIIERVFQRADHIIWSSRSGLEEASAFFLT
ncbi:hypothetical protein [Paenibacillus hexagrammi]|uniref:Glycosyltransferase subfamily 4-like N-terminal domain-containing protein n=1 Tax=Paenibacillus hexagrammi TaxID=2908839 RepID=A0ABY3SHS8_9BACL|nr:hypothetical protein [Paenibacillus sp. YPD9-1]UJF32784.1 hypothetical protein L0M14_24890 [Paenibacillus sp. YPD9-1]